MILDWGSNELVDETCIQSNESVLVVSIFFSSNVAFAGEICLLLESMLDKLWVF